MFVILLIPWIGFRKVHRIVCFNRKPFLKDEASLNFMSLSNKEATTELKILMKKSSSIYKKPKDSLSESDILILENNFCGKTQKCGRTKLQENVQKTNPLLFKMHQPIQINLDKHWNQGSRLFFLSQSSSKPKNILVDKQS